jgi:hypothetical protein
MLAMAGSEESTVATITCRLRRKETLRSTRSARTARSVRKMRKSRKILGSSAASEPTTTRMSSSATLMVTITKSNLFQGDRQ